MGRKERWPIPLFSSRLLPHLHRQGCGRSYATQHLSAPVEGRDRSEVQRWPALSSFRVYRFRQSLVTFHTVDQADLCQPEYFSSQHSSDPRFGFTSRENAQ